MSREPYIADEEDIRRDFIIGSDYYAYRSEDEVGEIFDRFMRRVRAEAWGEGSAHAWRTRGDGYMKIAQANPYEE